MRLSIAAACAEASHIWKRDRDVIAAVGGVFFFLPNLALSLFMRATSVTVGGDTQDDQALLASMQSFLVDNAPLLAFQMVAELVGVAVLLTLLLDPARPTVGEALRIVARRLPVLVAVTMLINIALVCGMALFIVPGLYVIGRAALVLPVLIGEPERRFGDAIGRALDLTRGRVIQLLSLWALIFIGAYFVQTLLQGLARAASSGGSNPVTLGMVAVATSAVSMATAIAYTLVRAAIYRRLASNG
ncbi:MULTISPECIES: hypothetical protein [unclassified Sphingomonas]|uniref:hypothetical protein n=1 Tax=unclassified Sphingomonas TaxID=196159 RepID=UPI0006F68B0D|nr:MULTISPECIES: hypothetical protein [unclassified Sphingomonas]KQM66689.1 hypothetical protein ASE65_00930 [Sphingomonas sp. Leaf16]KQN17638.1 hypothetical protein ASE81_00310 [Sphingomonas sp. Leaf29]KQN23501.1 hypothetical protein ASE83_03190 [Sphingomonas sp. Leaf32]